MREGERDAVVRTDVAADGTVNVEDACEFTGLKRTFIYKLMTDGKLAYTTVGRRRLIFRSSLRNLLRRDAVTPTADATPEDARV